MKKIFLILLSTTLIMSAFVACGDTSNGSDKILSSTEIETGSDIGVDDESIIEDSRSESINESSDVAEDEEWNGTYDVMPEPFKSIENSGGDENHVFYMMVNYKLDGIDASFCNMVGWDAAYEWVALYSTSDGLYTSVSEAANLYSFIKYFEIPDETVRKTLKSLQLGISEYELTDEEINLLLSGDDVAVAEYFASDNAIRKEDNLYSLYWVYEHSIEDYIEAGITTDDISGVLAAYDEVGLTSAAKSAITAKLNDYINGNYEVAE